MATFATCCRRCACSPRPPRASTSTLPPVRPLSTSASRAAPPRKGKEKEEVIPEHVRLERLREEERKDALRYKPPVWTGTLPAGTPLGFKIYKDQPAPVALPDEEYPAWLWRLLDRPKDESDPQRPGQVNRRTPIKEIRRQLDRERNSERALKMRNRTF